MLDHNPFFLPLTPQWRCDSHHGWGQAWFCKYINSSPFHQGGGEFPHNDDVCPLQYILIKFLGTVGADAERMGVHCIKVYGYSLSQEDIGRAAFVDRLVCVHDATCSYICCTGICHWFLAL